jgi:hypothetical protein
MPSAAPPRTLADQLRSWPDDRLGALLRLRPDLASPAPQDSSQLASRASTRASVLRALDGLTRLELVVLDAVVVLGGRATPAAVASVVHGAAPRVEAALDHLRALVLLWGDEEEVRVVSAVPECLGSGVSHLGPPVEQLVTGFGPERVAALLADLGERSSGDRASDVLEVARVLSDAVRVAALVEGLDQPARAMLDHLERTGSDGASESATQPVTAASATTPVEQLVARGLLLPRDKRHLVVPREVGVALRGGRTTREAVDEPPPLATTERAQRLVDRAAAGAAYELVHRTELLLDHWGAEAPTALRQGGVSVRDLKATAELMHADQRTAALHVEVASAAGLLAQGETAERDAAWLPTEAFDTWRGLPLAERWARLATAWLYGERLTGLVGGRLQGKGVNALAPDLERSWLPDARRTVLTEIASVAPGCVLAAGAGVPSLVARMHWLRPRRPASRADAVAWAVEEAAVIGVLGLGGVSTPGRALLDDGTDAAAAAVAPLLPRPVDHVLLQADLTAVAPGPLEESLARDLATVAQVESRGGATVYRFTEGSIRHAFDVGWSSAEVLETITRAARTEMPQPLRFLVDDVARTFGTVRVGAASAFLRSDDEAALAALVHDPGAASLRLRRIAPTVVVTDTPPDLLLPRLRELGVAPVVEGPDGVVHPTRKDAHRAATPRTRGAAQLAESAARLAARTSATVTAIRAGDRAAAVRPAAAAARPRQSPASALALLREAVDAGGTVWIDYVDNDGSTHERVVDPRRLDGGRLLAFDHRSEELRSFAVHRISSVRPL